jgi:mRNA-degrading endonuclease YafQ of YafQ-DinJ toxin-antitoxin module
LKDITFFPGKRWIVLSKKRHKDFEKLKTILQLLLAGEKLPLESRDHKLKGIL